jgi:hypothetical protein
VGSNRLTPCLQIAFSWWYTGADLRPRPSLMYRYAPLFVPANGTVILACLPAALTCSQDRSLDKRNSIGLSRGPPCATWRPGRSRVHPGMDEGGAQGSDLGASGPVDSELAQPPRSRSFVSQASRGIR